MCSLSKHAKFFTSLRELNLSSNSIKKTGFLALISSLNSAFCLEKLNLSWNPIGDKAVEKGLLDLLKIEELREIDLKGTKITQKAVKLVRNLMSFEVVC